MLSGGLVMALTKYKLGDLIELLNLRNTNMEFDVNYVRGVNNLKHLMPTKADLTTRDISKFQIVKPQNFVFNHRTSRNGDKFSIAFNDTDSPVICTEDYVVFRIKNDCEKILLPLFLYLYFNRSEFDRYVIMNSWGSSTEFYNWSDICDIEIDLPPIEVQQKYVNIYKSMLENQKCYETALDDLKLVCDAYIEDLRRKYPSCKIGQYIKETSKKNTDGKITLVQGVESSGTYMDTRAKMTGIDISKYKVVSEKDFAYNPSRINLGSIALRSNGQCIVSPMYTVFRVINNNKLIPEYLSLCLSRKEFHRSTLFYATGSVRDTFDFSLMKDVEIPIPDIEIQRSIADIYKVYMERKQINEQLKEQIKNICPILIRGAIKECLNG